MGDALEIESPAIKQISDRVSKTRKRMRQLNPALDAYLYQFDYTTTFENVQTKEMGKVLIEDPTFDPFSLPTSN